MVEQVARLSDWRPRFSSYLIDVAFKPFAWGENDCAMHPGNAVLAMTGVDLVADFRGRYFTELGATRALIKYGAGDLASTLAQRLPEIDPRDAVCGDVVILDGPLGATGGLRLKTCISAVTPNGTRPYALDLVTRAFQVGVR
jgi:hypothetical protein